jgi:hypothetical protein
MTVEYLSLDPTYCDFVDVSVKPSRDDIITDVLDGAFPLVDGHDEPYLEWPPIDDTFVLVLMRLLSQHPSNLQRKAKIQLEVAMASSYPRGNEPSPQDRGELRFARLKARVLSNSDRVLAHPQE